MRDRHDHQQRQDDELHATGGFNIHDILPIIDNPKIEGYLIPSNSQLVRIADIIAW